MSELVTATDSRRLTDAITRFIRDVGFPVAVCAYLLLSLGPKIDTMIISVNRLVVVMEAKR